MNNVKIILHWSNMVCIIVFFRPPSTRRYREELLFIIIIIISKTRSLSNGNYLILRAYMRSLALYLYTMLPNQLPWPFGSFKTMETDLVGLIQAGCLSRMTSKRTNISVGYIITRMHKLLAHISPPTMNCGKIFNENSSTRLLEKTKIHPEKSRERYLDGFKHESR